MAVRATFRGTSYCFHIEWSLHFLKLHVQSIFGTRKSVNLLAAGFGDDTIQIDGASGQEIKKLANEHAFVLSTLFQAGEAGA